MCSTTAIQCHIDTQQNDTSSFSAESCSVEAQIEKIMLPCTVLQASVKYMFESFFRMGHICVEGCSFDYILYVTCEMLLKRCLCLNWVKFC